MMLNWTIKSLFSQLGSIFGSAAGIASAFILVIFFNAVWQGESDQIVAYPNKMNPDVWVMQKGVANMHMAMSFVWDWKADIIRKMPEVKNVTPILYLNTVLNVGDQKLFAFVVGLVGKDNRAGPWKINHGRNIENTGEIVIPAPISTLANVSLGDKIQLANKAFTVVGLSDGTYSSANPVFFTLFSDLQDILESFGTYSYLLVDVYDDVDSQLLAKNIMRRVDKVNAITHREFIANDYALAKQMGVEIIMMMTLICSILAALIVGYSAYSLVNRKKKELATLKAIGASNRSVFVSIVVQSLIVTAIAYFIALLFALLVIPQIPLLVPQITVKVTLSALSKLGGTAFIVAVVGALIPASMVVRLDPAIAYQN